MRCKECGEPAQDPTLRYCENCGAKMPTPPPGAIRRTSPGAASIQGSGRPRSTSAARAVPARDEAEDTDPGRPAAPPYDGPVWLAHVPGHSPTVAGVGLLALALVLSILPFFASVGALGWLATFVGGWVVTAREMRAASQKHPLVDWVPDTLMHPAVPAVYALVTAGLAIRMLGIGLTPLLWLGGAALIGFDQYRKVYAGETGWSRLFEPRQLLRGPPMVALGGVALCLVSLFLTWTPTPASSRYSAPVPMGPPGLQVADAPRPSDDVVYGMLSSSYDAGWDKPFAEGMELMLLAVLVLLALRPEVPRPDPVRFAPIAVVVTGLVWMLTCGALLPGPLLFLAGLGAVGFTGVYQALHREA